MICSGQQKITIPISHHLSMCYSHLPEASSFCVVQRFISIDFLAQIFFLQSQGILRNLMSLDSSECHTVPYCAIFQGTTYFLVIGSRHYSRSCHPIHPPAQDGTCDWQSHLATADEAGPLPNPVGSERFPPEDQWALKQKQSQIDKYERVTGSMVVQAIAHTCTHVIYQDISHRSFS